MDIMSFFFVLSGFVSAYARSDEESGIDFLCRRLKKTYPLYFFMLFLDLPGGIYNHIVHDQYRCNTSFWIYRVCQFFLSHSWLAWGAVEANMPSWYISTLFWHWLAFSCCDLRKLLKPRPWTAVCIFYVTSLGLCFAMAPFDQRNTKLFPPLRLLEFFMGCAVACSLKKESREFHWVIPLCAFILYLIYACLTLTMQDVWDRTIMHTNHTLSCDFWQHVNNWDVRPAQFVTITSPVWAILIHWLAFSETQNSSYTVVKFLQFDFFKSLACMSLQVYLTHMVTWMTYRSIATFAGIYDWLNTEWEIIVCYGSAYFVYSYIQPQLNRLVKI